MNGLASHAALAAALLSSTDSMFQRSVSQDRVLELTPHHGSSSNSHTVEVSADGIVTFDGQPGSNVTVRYRYDTSWTYPRHQKLNNKKHLSKDKKRTQKKIAAASRKRNRK